MLWEHHFPLLFLLLHRLRRRVLQLKRSSVRISTVRVIRSNTTATIITSTAPVRVFSFLFPLAVTGMAAAFSGEGAEDG